MKRKICFDTETTGLYPEQGDRIFEIGFVELINDIRTGKTLQYYINPEKPLSQESIEISGIKDDFLKDKPKFSDVVNDMLEFIKDSALVAHNAAFDIKFLNNELKLLAKEPIENEVIDTLLLARKKFPGQKASLDALCKRFNIDNSKRVFHGALLDADLLVDVYIHLIDGIEKRLIEDEESIENNNRENEDNFVDLLIKIKNRKIKPVRKFFVDTKELKNHEEFIKDKINGSLWDYGKS
jgi:DNA polymerase-3 subunit epsilon